MSPPPVYTTETLPLIWSIMGSPPAIHGVGHAQLNRHLAEGLFTADIDGVDDNGCALATRWLRAYAGSGNTPRQSSWGRYAGQNVEEIKLLCGLIGYGSDPWRRDNKGKDLVDYVFDLGIDAVLKDLVPQDPAGPAAWKNRLAKSSTYNNTRILPWLHYVARSEQNAVADMGMLLGLPEADPNQLDADGNTPLFHVCTPAAAKFLLEHGANPSHRNNAGESVLARWASARLSSAVLSEMKKLVEDHGFQASGSEVETDFRDMAKSATATVLIPLFNQLGLENRAGEFIPAALDRLLRTSGYSRQEQRTAWSWLDFLVQKPGSIEALPQVRLAQLHLLANAENPAEPDANASNRTKVRKALDARAPMPLMQAWEVLVEQAEFPKDSYAVQCIDQLRQQVGARAAAQPELLDLWLRLTLRDDAPTKLSANPLPLVPWMPSAKEKVDVLDHPRAWELLAHSAKKLSQKDLAAALDVLTEHKTPLLSGSFSWPDDVDAEKLAIIEQAVYQAHTPAVSTSRRSPRL